MNKLLFTFSSMTNGYVEISGTELPISLEGDRLISCGLKVGDKFLAIINDDLDIDEIETYNNELTSNELEIQQGNSMITIIHNTAITHYEGFHELNWGDPFYLEGELCIKLDTDQYVNLEDDGHVLDYKGQAIVPVEIEINVKSAKVRQD